ncbi:hypothetical protein CRG98_035928 [Punica granatum]|uniref:Uncharacterized protein n=1 Tax=Punica granatum TaxID=22663 RepID=A0A2I0II69_PUNGR|nr:hypothetical protein CRG98_035928 [Punica granatum]
MTVNYKDWHERLPFALLAYRTSVRSSTGATPYSLVYGMEAVLLVEVKISSMRILAESKLKEAEWAKQRYEQLNIIDERWLTALCHGQCYQQRMARAFNKKFVPASSAPATSSKHCYLDFFVHLHYGYSMRMTKIISFSLPFAEPARSCLLQPCRVCSPVRVYFSASQVRRACSLVPLATLPGLLTRASLLFCFASSPNLLARASYNLAGSAHPCEFTFLLRKFAEPARSCLLQPCRVCSPVRVYFSASQVRRACSLVLLATLPSLLTYASFLLCFANLLGLLTHASSKT